MNSFAKMRSFDSLKGTVLRLGNVSPLALVCAVVLVIQLAAPANSAIIYGVVDQTLADQSLDGTPVGLLFTVGGSNLTFNHDIGGENAATGQAYLDLNGIELVGKNVGGFMYASRLSTGDIVGPTSNFLSSPNTVDLALDAEFPADPNFEFATSGIGFLGFRFDSNRYGWIQIEMLNTPTTPNLNSFRVIDYAYGAANQNMVVGVPEPTSMFLLASIGAFYGYRSIRRVR